MPNPKLETYKNKATGTVYDFTDADAQSKVTATVDLMKDTTGWIGGNEVDVAKYNHISTNCVANAVGDVMTFTAPITATGQYAELSYYASQTSDILFDRNVKRKMMIIVTAITSNKAAIGVRNSESRFIKTLKFESTGTYILDLSDVAEDYYVGVYPRWEYNNAEASMTFKLMLLTEEQYVLNPSYRPYHESVEDWYWSENAKTGVHNFVLGGLSGYSIGAQGNIYADATYDLHFGLVTQGESYRVTTDDSAGFVGGYFTSMPTPSSVTYNSSRVVSANKTFTAPIDGYVVFRTTHNYATPMFCLADDSYDGYTKGAMTNSELTDAVTPKKLEETSTSEQAARITVPTSFRIAYVFVSIDSDKTFQCVIVKGISSRAFRFTYKASSNTEVRGYIWYDYTNSRIEVGSFMVNDVEMKNDTNIKLEVFYI